MRVHWEIFLVESAIPFPGIQFNEEFNHLNNKNNEKKTTIIPACLVGHDRKSAPTGTAHL